MKRIFLINLLNDYLTLNKEEKECRERMLQFIEENEDCFERSLEKGHITASAWLLNREGTQALLMHHAKLGVWCQLGGHCDGDSDPLRVALKEASEESGIQAIIPIKKGIFDIDIHLIPEYKGIKAHYHYDVRFILQVVSNEEIKINHEAKDLRWIGKRRDLLPTDALSVTRMFDKWIGEK
ncbi:MAG: NUDIX hydrolase [Simkaniaceae bacterium]|nr:NUDIX hydrolase [Simkaniaceae bacterium]